MIKKKTIIENILAAITAIIVVLIILYFISPYLFPMDGFGYEMARICCEQNLTLTPDGDNCSFYIQTWLGEC